MTVPEVSQAPNATTTVVDGVHRLQPTGISILIVGGGIAGLTLANEAWRQGHDVRVLERSPELDVIGDTFGILPPALVTLRHFPSLLQEFEATSYDALFSFYSHVGRKLLGVGEAPWNQPGAKHAAEGVRVPWIRSRYGLVAALEGQVRRLGIPIEYGKNVISYAEDGTKAAVQTDEGRVYHGDLVVAADGVGTKSHKHVLGSVARPISSGAAAYRGMIPISRLKDISDDAKKRYLSSDRPEFRVYLAGRMHMNVIITPDFVNYVLTHEDSGSADEAWRSTLPGSAVLKMIDAVPGWDPALKEIIAQTPEKSVVDWKLLWRNPQPQWSSRLGRVLQLGDSAHSFLPTSGNGATQAMEDALSLATCLALGGKDNIVESVKTHVRLRFERVSALQRFGFVNRQTLHNINVEEFEKNPAIVPMKMSRWIWTHDPVQYAHDNFSKALASIVNGAEFENTNLPTGFKYEPWTIEEELAREEQGLGSTLYSTGDWS
ncbi:hypothetical protein B0I35DRAFT_450412 [Stachybotrys elegans]|uniref:FAD-binding domain-containing protein n=1 Tax=Stachybotrys elegans TaxID=80388 RepID=A0A8K0SYR7_9HYPO|nr:hypothetical protein B0I35DRAFT_450412 [Stachybotrys elegans]